MKIKAGSIDIEDKKMLGIDDPVEAVVREKVGFLLDQVFHDGYRLDCEGYTGEDPEHMTIEYKVSFSVKVIPDE